MDDVDEMLAIIRTTKSKIRTLMRQHVEVVDTIRKIRDIINSDELCAEAMVSEIGELIGECE